MILTHPVPTMLSPECGVCKIHNDPFLRETYEVVRGRLWLLRHHPDPAPMAGWFLLDSRRHISGPIDFDPEEAAHWGNAVKDACRVVSEVTGCDRVYLIAFGEGARHLHLHLIPRFGAESASEAWKVADLYRSVATGSRNPAEPRAVAKATAHARASWDQLRSQT